MKRLILAGAAALGSAAFMLLLLPGSWPMSFLIPILLVFIPQFLQENIVPMPWGRRLLVSALLCAGLAGLTALSCTTDSCTEQLGKYLILCAACFPVLIGKHFFLIFWNRKRDASE